MRRINGNITAVVLEKSTTKNEIGESIETWSEINIIKGFLDLSSGDSKYNNYNAKIQESTHLFLCNYTDNITTENKLKINGKFYDIMLVDSIMELNEHLEIYLQFTGGQIE